MRVFGNILIVFLFCSTTAVAAPASDRSIKQLLAVTQTKTLVDGIGVQLDSLMNNTMRQVLAGKTPTARQQKIIGKMKSRTVALMHRELEWEKLEPMYIRLFRESFTEEEVAGMLSFYETPAGQAVIYKMPVLMQKTMQDMQKMTERIAPEMQKIQESFVAEMSVAD